MAKTAEYDFKVCGDTLLTALFEAEPIPVPKKCSLTLTAQPADAGVLSGSGEYDENTKVELNATANEGYRFVAWMSSATDTLSKEAATWFTITCDTTLTALFVEESEPGPNPEPEKYMVLLIAYPGEGGTLSGAGEYNENETVTVNASVNEGFRFVAWLTPDADTLCKTTEFQFTITRDTALMAVFESEEEPQPETYTLSLTASPPMQGC